MVHWQGLDFQAAVPSLIPVWLVGNKGWHSANHKLLSEMHLRVTTCCDVREVFGKL